MVSVSLCMIVKNEEDVIERCLKSIADIVDEIVIVDTGSSDNTKAIASKFTGKIFDFEWIDDFSAARNYSFSKATKEYILWLDADDIILEQDRIKLKQLKETLDLTTDGVMMMYNYSFDTHGNVTLSHFRERLVKRSNGSKWHEPIHEYLDVQGNIINSDITITHSKTHSNPSGRNLKIFENLLLKGIDLSTRSIFYYARELYYNSRYEDAIIYFNKFLDLKKGWIEDKISACRDLSICYKHLNNNKDRFKTLIRSFEYDNPRAEICCELGYYYKDLREYEKAIFWFKLASKIKKNEDGWGFILNDCYGYIPNIELCVCYDRLGDKDKAIKYNLKAQEYKPNTPSVIHNEDYFNKVSLESKLKQILREKEQLVHLRERYKYYAHPPISIISPINKEKYIDNLLKNYERSSYCDKELIIILNNNSLNLEKLKSKAKKYKNVRVFQLDESATLGECLNFGIEKAAYDYTAKMDDGGYYGENYLTDLMNAFNYTNSEIVGKGTHFAYIETENKLGIWRNHVDRMYLTYLSGEAWLAKKSVFKKLQFKKVNVGEDTEFFYQCANMGIKVYSADKFNYVYMRHNNPNEHIPKDIQKETDSVFSDFLITEDFISYATV